MAPIEDETVRGGTNQGKYASHFTGAACVI